MTQLLSFQYMSQWLWWLGGDDDFDDDYDDKIFNLAFFLLYLSQQMQNI